MFMITSNRHTYISTDIKDAADIIYGETGNENDLYRIPHILGNMHFEEMFHGNGFVVQCYCEEED